MKKLILVEKRGFCSGVSKALSIVDRVLLEYSAPVYVYNEIVHNSSIVSNLKNRGVKFITSINDIPSRVPIIFSAHGVSPLVRQKASENNCFIIDATCAIVKKVHDKVHEYVRQGYYIIYIGHKNHEEVQGVIGESPENIFIVESVGEVDAIPRQFRKYVILSQTTLSFFQVDPIVAAVKMILPQAISDANICSATTVRQRAVMRTAEQVDAFVVLGSKNSSNSNRLREVASATVPAYLVDRAEDLDLEEICKYSNIGLTSGASVPEYLVEEAVFLFKEELGFIEA